MAGPFIRGSFRLEGMSNYLAPVTTLRAAAVKRSSWAGSTTPVAWREATIVFVIFTAAQLADGLIWLDRAQSHRPFVGLGGHDHHASCSKEKNAIGQVVRLPQVRALHEAPDAPQCTVARQMIQRDARQCFAVAMMWKFRRVHGRDSRAPSPRRNRSEMRRRSRIVESQRIP